MQEPDTGVRGEDPKQQMARLCAAMLPKVAEQMEKHLAEPTRQTGAVTSLMRLICECALELKPEAVQGEGANVVYKLVDAKRAAEVLTERLAARAGR